MIYISKPSITFINPHNSILTMGRIKTALMKRVTHGMMERHADVVKPTFDENKALVNKYTDVQSKKMRNIIAGYIARLVKHGNK